MTAAMALVIKADGSAVIAEAEQGPLPAGDQESPDPNLDALTEASGEAAVGMQEAAAAAFNLGDALRAAAAGEPPAERASDGAAGAGGGKREEQRKGGS